MIESTVIYVIPARDVISNLRQVRPLVIFIGHAPLRSIYGRWSNLCVSFLCSTSSFLYYLLFMLPLCSVSLLFRLPRCYCTLSFLCDVQFFSNQSENPTLCHSLKSDLRPPHCHHTQHLTVLITRLRRSGPNKILEKIPAAYAN